MNWLASVDETERKVSDQHQRVTLALRIGYQLTVLCLVSYVLFRCCWPWIPVGAVGQPRATPLPESWSIPWQLTLLLGSLVTLLFFAPRFPAIGLGAYLFLSFVFSVHSEEWIFVRAIWLPSAIAIATLCAALLHACRRGTRIGGFASEGIDRLLLAFVLWCLFCSGIAAWSSNSYQPALQFHPIQLVEAVALFFAIRFSGNRPVAMSVIALVVIATLAIRILIDGLTYRDAGIATDVALAIPLAGYLATRSGRWLPYVLGIALALSGLVILGMVQNRGAIIGILFGMIALLLTVRHRTRVILVMTPLAFLLLWMLSKTSLGNRFASIGGLQTILQSNQRIQIWQAGFEIAKENPIAGIGPGNFVHGVGRFDASVADHSAHNLFVDVLAETGFIGLVLFAILLVCVVRSCLRSCHAGCTASRWVLVAQAVWIGCGMFLTTTMFTLPYILLAFVPTIENTQKPLQSADVIPLD